MINLDGMLFFIVMGAALIGWAAIEAMLWLVSFITIG
jgi:hypothetical protein